MSNAQFLAKLKQAKTGSSLVIDFEKDLIIDETSTGIQFAKFYATDGRQVGFYFSQEKTLAEFEEACDNDGVWPSDLKSTRRIWKNGSGFMISDMGGNTNSMFD